MTGGPGGVADRAGDDQPGDRRRAHRCDRNGLQRRRSGHLADRLRLHRRRRVPDRDSTSTTPSASRTPSPIPPGRPRYAYDAYGNMVRETEAGRRRTSRRYDAEGNLLTTTSRASPANPTPRARKGSGRHVQGLRPGRPAGSESPTPWAGTTSVHVHRQRSAGDGDPQRSEHRCHLRGWSRTAYDAAGNLIQRGHQQRRHRRRR